MTTTREDDVAEIRRAVVATVVSDAHIVVRGGDASARTSMVDSILEAIASREGALIVREVVPRRGLGEVAAEQFLAEWLAAGIEAVGEPAVMRTQLVNYITGRGPAPFGHCYGGAFADRFEDGLRVIVELAEIAGWSLVFVLDHADRLKAGDHCWWSLQAAFAHVARTRYRTVRLVLEGAAVLRRIVAYPDSEMMYRHVVLPD